MRVFKFRPFGVALASANMVVFVLLLMFRSPNYDALHLQDAGAGALADFETVYLSGRPFPIGPMHSSPGDLGWVYVQANVFAAIAAEFPTLLLGGLLFSSAAGVSWLRALLFSVGASLQWFLIGSAVESMYRWATRSAA